MKISMTVQRKRKTGSSTADMANKSGGVSLGKLNKIGYFTIPPLFTLHGRGHRFAVYLPADDPAAFRLDGLHFRLSWPVHNTSI